MPNRDKLATQDADVTPMADGSGSKSRSRKEAEKLMGLFKQAKVSLL